MLVLTRGRNEIIDIQPKGSIGGIEIIIVDIRTDRVRIGISAPKDFTVHRREVTERIEAENKSTQEDQ